MKQKTFIPSYQILSPVLKGAELDKVFFGPFRSGRFILCWSEKGIYQIISLQLRTDL